jgi:uncharacterized membrane protein YraQ (UPF0718 family)
MSTAFLREDQKRLGGAEKLKTNPAPALAAPSVSAEALQVRPQLMARSDLILLGLLVVALLAPNYLVQHGPYLYKIYVWTVGMVLVFGYAFWAKPLEEIKRWMGETWWFLRLIFPLLLVGVFIVGIIGAVLPESWIQRWLGGSGLLSSFLATLIGGVSYFATMTEAPFVDKLMELGMGPGPALALLLTGPGISLPNWLAVARIFGVKKAVVYVLTVIVLGTVVGWVSGNLIF